MRGASAGCTKMVRQHSGFGIRWHVLKGPDCAQVTEEEQAAAPVDETERAPLGPFCLGVQVLQFTYDAFYMTTQRKAVALIPGGVDPMSAAKIILDQGIHVEGVNFFTKFFIADHTHRVYAQHRNEVMHTHAPSISDQVGIKPCIIDLREPYQTVVLNLDLEYGTHVAPWLAGERGMLGNTREWMYPHQIDFCTTGKVVERRQQSPLKRKLVIIARKSGDCVRPLRPLNARVVESALPERGGCVDRERLGRISSCTRKAQRAMADPYGVGGYSHPITGICLVTDRNGAASGYA